jgi:hypothetical protein
MHALPTGRGKEAEPMKHLLIEMGWHSLEVAVADDVDLDDAFEATCLDTGELLRINGWLMASVEELELAA